MGVASPVRARDSFGRNHVTLGLVLVSLHPLSSRADTPDPPCVNPQAYTHSVVSITRLFGTARPLGVDVVGAHATAWFYTSSRFLVTNAHFAAVLRPGDWQGVELRWGSREGAPDRLVKADVRVWTMGSPARNAEDLAVLELRDPPPDAQALEIRPEPPSPDEKVVVLGYPNGTLRFANGVVRQIEDSERRYSGLSLLEVQGADRLVLNHGASGGPVLDCRRGRVTAVLNGVLTATLKLPLLPPEGVVIPTPHGSPTNTAVPIQALRALMNRPL